MPISRLFARVAILVAMVGFVVPASAQESVKTTVQNKTYIAEGAIDLTQFLSPPSANDSVATQKEIDELQDAIVNVETLINSAKSYYHRSRPYILDARIQPVLPKPNNDSYPSGHSTAGHFFAIILAHVCRKKRRAFLRRVESFALNRVIGGVHYPTDVEAGKLSGTSYCRRNVHKCRVPQGFQESSR